MEIRSVNEADLKNKNVMVRVDYNVPMEGRVVLDNTRILESVPNIKYILESGAKKVILVSHLGRPVGSVVDDLRLKPIVSELESLLGEEVDYFDVDVNTVTREMLNLSGKRVVCLENIRFDQREEEGSEELAQLLAKLADVYVLDAFSVAHREHASVTKMAKYLESYGGLNLINEYEGISRFLNNIKKPFWGFFGGIKLEDKMPVIQALADKLDGIVFGSSIALAFLNRFGFGVGDSILANNSDKSVNEFLDFLAKKSIKVVFPDDLVIGDAVSAKKTKVFDIDFNKIIQKEMPHSFVVCEEQEAIFDIGEKSIVKFNSITNMAGSIFWNGPFGFVEKDDFKRGSEAIAIMIANSPAYTLVGGGDTVALLANMDMKDKYNYVSTSGGAMMTYIAKGTLPGLEILNK
ncbi:MAG: phosphoglycerate kinase [Patescibacteria group bacterium]